MKATNNSLSKNGKDTVMEFSGDAQIYIGAEMLEAFVKRVIHSRPVIQVQSGDDLNDYHEPGEYRVNNSTIAATVDHIPVTTSGGRLVVEWEYGNNTTEYIRQIYYVGGGSAQIYTRKTATGGTWNAWYRIEMTAV